jgi:hypothetical protein
MPPPDAPAGRGAPGAADTLDLILRGLIAQGSPRTQRWAERLLNGEAAQGEPPEQDSPPNETARGTVPRA